MRTTRILLSWLLACSAAPLAARVTLDYNDAYQLFGSILPSSILNKESRQLLKDQGTGIDERFFLQVSMYGQKATTARDLKKQSVPVANVHGNLNMIGLTYGNLPIGVTQPSLLQTAGQQAYYWPQPPNNNPLFSNPTYTDETQQFGFFSNAGKYHKIGLRFQTGVRICEDIIFSIQAGVADLQQTTTLIDLTPNSSYQNVYPASASYVLSFTPDQATAEQYFMEPARAIFTQLGAIVDSDIQKTGAEDVSFYLTLRHNFPVNQDADPEDWPYFIFTPIIQVGATAAAAKPKNPDIPYDLCLGNNRHQSVNIAGGFNFDFAETIEVDFFAGLTHFFSRTYLARVPTSIYQSVLFPYSTNIKVSPGDSWFISLGLNAYHFLENLSVYVQYLYTQHLTDTVQLVTPDPAFIPSRLEQDTPFKVQVANFGFDYDLSPNFALGVGYQMPLARRGAYKANTVLLSVTFTF